MPFLNLWNQSLALLRRRPETMSAQLFDLSYNRAVRQWLEVSRLEKQLAAARDEADSFRESALWVPELDRPAMSAADARVEGLNATFQSLRTRALLTSSQAAKALWGVELGGTYSFVMKDGPTITFRVTMLRPVECTSDSQICAFLCAGVSGLLDRVVFLGIDALTVQPVLDNVVAIAPRLR